MLLGFTIRQQNCFAYAESCSRVACFDTIGTPDIVPPLKMLQEAKETVVNPTKFERGVCHKNGRICRHLHVPHSALLFVLSQSPSA